MTAQNAVVVTGASSGIGSAIATLLASRGLTVLAGVRRDEDGDRLAAAAAEAIERAGSPGRLQPIRLDITSEPDVAALADTVASGFEQGVRLRGLVNNAGIAVTGPIEIVSLDDWRRQLEINVIGQVAVTRALIPTLIRSRGRVINMSSIAGRGAVPLFAPYAASKFALEAFTDVLRRELRPHGVTAVAIEPGMVATPIWGKGAQAAPAIEGAPPHVVARYRHPLDRLHAMAQRAMTHGLPPERVAEVVATALTVARPRTRYVVGRSAKVQTALARVLPDRAMDAAIARLYG